MPKSRIIRNGNAFLLEIDGQQLPMYGYMSYQPEKAKYEDFKKAGVHLFFTAVYAGDRGINQQSGIRPFRKGFWMGYGRYDFSQVDADFRTILKDSRPGENYLIPRLMVEPPSWWDDANPDELCRDAQGTPLHHSFNSVKWREDTRVMMQAFRQWLEDSGWAAYVPGWHVACGNTEEFLRPNHHPMQFTDYSAPAQRAFSEWTKRKYGTIEAANTAWHTGYASFDGQLIPGPAKRIFAVYGSMRDPETEKQTIDYYRFLNESHAQACIDLCAMAKEITGGEQVIGAFFGYTSCGMESGQHAARLVFESDKVDFLASPFTYTDNRGQGVDWAFPGSVESAALHGKPWFIEADVRTCYSKPISRCMPFADPVVSRAYDGPVWYGPDTLDGSLGQMKKAFARILTHNTAVWWFDMWGGWYDDAQLMEFHRQAFEVYRAHVLSGGSENAAPIALFVDDELFDEVMDDYTERLCSRMWKDLGYAGTPYRMYMIDDLPKVDPSRFRLAIFSSVKHWNGKRVDALKNWKKDGRILAFTGPVDASQASGVQTAAWDEAELLSSEQERPINVQKVRPEAVPGDVILCRAEDGRATELLRRMDEYSVYCTTDISLSAEKLRVLTAAAGGQVYCFSGDCIYASDKYVAIHAASEGIKRICYHKKAEPVEVFTGETAPGNESFVDVKLDFGETRLYEFKEEKSGIRK